MAPPQLQRAFAMADIAGSARLWNRYPERMSDGLAWHDAIASRSVRAVGGEVFKHTGDGFLAVFADVASAVESMIDYQRALTEEAAFETVEIRSRVCVHWGSAEQREGDWFGPAVNQLARLTDLVAPTHVVLSASAAERFEPATDEVDHLGAFSVRDVPEPVPLFAIQLPHAVGPALTIAAGSGLPQYKSALVGRGGDVDTVRDLLDRYRLVTILGFGGMGKTRLAVEVAQQWAEGHGVRAHFVDLTSSDDPIVAVAAAVGIPSGRITPETSALDIAKHLGIGAVLLVVDNCEHVIEAAAATCDALTSACRDLRVLATSREALELDGEAIYVLGSLEIEAAVELLRTRASAVGTNDLPDTLAVRLCERVEYMPLGIELVVARLRQVDAIELAGALDESLDELRVRRRAGDDRHATMRSLIQWSYELLSEHEQTLLLQLSQLPSPWLRSTATVFGADSGAELLDGLIAKSMVMPAPAGHFRILEPIRQYCAEVLLADATRTEAARAALVAWGRNFVPPLPDDRDPIIDIQATRALVDQLPNLRAALEAAETCGRTADEAAIMIGLWPLVGDGRARAWFGKQLEDTLSRSTDPARRRTLIRLALQDTSEHHVDLAREERLIAQLRALEPDDISAESTIVHLNRAVRQMVVDRVLGLDPTTTRRIIATCADVARANGSRLDYGLATLFSAFSHMLNGDHPECLAAAEQAADLARQINFVTVAALADATAAMSMQAQGDVATALRIARAAVPLSEDARWESSVRAVHALLLGRAGQHDEARAAVAEMVALALAQAVPFVLFDAVIALAATNAAAGDLTGAAKAIDLAGIGRTPLTIALMFEIAAEIKFDLGFDRFVESLDPDAVDRRAEQVATYLMEIRPELEAVGSPRLD